MNADPRTIVKDHERTMNQLRTMMLAMTDEQLDAVSDSLSRHYAHVSLERLSRAIA